MDINGWYKPSKTGGLWHCYTNINPSWKTPRGFTLSPLQIPLILGTGPSAKIRVATGGVFGHGKHHMLVGLLPRVLLVESSLIRQKDAHTHFTLLVNHSYPDKMAAMILPFVWWDTHRYPCLMLESILEIFLCRGFPTMRELVVPIQDGWDLIGS